MIHDERIETMRDNYDDHGAELAAKDAEIERLRSVAVSREERVRGLIAEIERERSAWENVVADKHFEIERLHAAIAERDEELRSLRLIIANKDARFQRVREALGDA